MTGSRRADRQTNHRLSRRGLLATVGAAAVGAAVPSAASAQETAVWPLYQYDRSNTGDARRVQGPRGTAGSRWQYGDGGSFTATPVVTDSTVYAPDEGGGALVAVDRATGAERWRVDVDVGTARMTYHDGTLLVPADSLEARSAADGSRQWRATMAGAQSVVVRTEYAYVTALSGVYRVSLTSKAVDWTFDRVTQVQPGLALSGEYAYLTGTRFGKTYALNPATGNRRWDRRLDGGGTGAPTAAGDQVFVPTDAGLFALRYESGTTNWSVAEAMGSSVAVADGTVYAATAAGDVVALAADSGTEQWRQALDVGSNPPVLAGGLLYVTGAGGSLLALAPQDGTVVWRSSVGGARSSNVAVAGGDLYVGDDEGTLVALAEGASPATDTPTPAATGEPTEEATPTSDGEPTAGTSPTTTEGPGFGLGAGAAALGGGALAVRRWLADGE